MALACCAMVLLLALDAKRAEAELLLFPDPPTIVSTEPASPANHNTPKVRGQAQSHTTVDLYTDPLCLGTSVGRGSAETFETSGISVPVEDDSTTTFFARSTTADLNLLRSACSATSVTYREDSTAPEATVTGGPSGTTGGSPSFAFDSSEAASTFLCRLDDAPFEACEAPKAYTDLSEGPHVFAVKAVDAAGNAGGAATRGFAVDAAAPQTTVDEGPEGPTNDASPVFRFSSSETGSSFRCRLDAGAWEPCASPKTYGTPLPLSDGNHAFSVEATDAAGNADGTPATRSFTVDTGRPDSTITAGPANGSTIRARAATFEFDSDEDRSAFRCRLDDGAWQECTSPQTYDDLGDGPHRFSVEATDAAGNSEWLSASRAFTVDATPPETTVDSGPQGLTTDPTPEFQFHSDDADATFRCSLDGGEPEVCTSPRTYGVGLGEGPHTFTVAAVDAAGNADPTPAVRGFDVDTVVPETTILSGPEDGSVVASDTATFTFESDDAGATFRCSLDGGAYAGCENPTTLTDLAEGPHTLRVRAVDAAGNEDRSPESVNFTVRIPPQTTIDAAPSGTQTTRSATFEFHSDREGSTFRCQLDAGAWEPCTSAKTYEDLPDGERTFSVVAVDRAGTEDPSPDTATFTVDATGPRIGILSVSRAMFDISKHKAVRVLFSIEESSTASVTVQRGGKTVANLGAVPSGGPGSVTWGGRTSAGKKVRKGTYEVVVEATDAAGNTSVRRSSLKVRR